MPAKFQCLTRGFERLTIRIAAHVAVRHVRVAALFVMPVERVQVMMLGATVLRARRRGGCLGGFSLLAHVRVLREDACAAETQGEGEREHDAGFLVTMKFSS